MGQPLFICVWVYEQSRVATRRDRHLTNHVINGDDNALARPTDKLGRLKPLARRRSRQAATLLSHPRKAKKRRSHECFVRPSCVGAEGFEPPTLCL